MPFRGLKPITLSLLLAAAAPLCAAGPGTAAADFLRIPVGARETALGGAFTAASSDANAVFYNPAGLALLEVPELSYSYNNYFSGISQQWMAAAMPAGGGTFGLGLNYLNIAAFDAYDAADNGIGSVSAYGLAAHLGYGSSIRTGSSLVPSLRYGAAVKFISEKLAASRASGYGFDAGLLLLPGIKNLRLGFAAENITSSRLEFISEGAKPARNFKAGAAYLAGAPGDDLEAQLSLDMNFPADGPAYLAAGVENTLYGAVSLRAGYTAFGDLSNGLSFGVGLRVPGRRNMRLDYSFGSSYDLGNVHKFGLAWRFSPPSPKAAAVETPAAPAAPSAEPVTEFGRQLDLLYNGTAEESRAAAGYLAAQDDERVIEYFTSLLYSGETGRRLVGVYGLSQLKDSRSLKALESGLRDQAPEVRREAALALGERKDGAAAPALEEALKVETFKDVKSAIIKSLVELPVKKD